jgi:transcriptional regulator with XRE-family HTH domain
MADLRTRFGKLVAAHRRRLGWTQDELCARASISVDMVSRIEAGSTGVRFATITKLAEALSVDPAELFTPNLPGGALERGKLTEITSGLARLSDKDLEWVDNVLAAVLKHR